MTSMQTRDGIDVDLQVVPDSPAAWKRLDTVLSRVDRLVNAIAAIDPDWQLDLAIGWNAANTIHLTAIPATDQKDAA